MNLDRQTVKYIREQIQQTLDTYFPERKRFKIEVGNATFTDSEVTFKVNFATIGKNGEVKDKSAEDFKRAAFAYGLKPEDLGKSFVTAGVQYTITGLKRSSRRYPILAKRSDGKQYKFPADMVKLHLDSKYKSPRR